jgi:hypothetical protein
MLLTDQDMQADVEFLPTLIGIGRSFREAADTADDSPDSYVSAIKVDSSRHSRGTAWSQRRMQIVVSGRVGALHQDYRGLQPYPARLSVTTAVKEATVAGCYVLEGKRRLQSTV